MPAAVVAVAGMAAGYGAAVGMGMTVVAAGVTSLTMAGSLVAGVVSMAASSVLSSAVGLNDSQEEESVASVAKGVLLNTASTVDPIMVVYGDRRLGGTRVLTEVSGASNEYLHIVITHCEGPIASIDTVYLDGTPTTDAKFAGLVTVEKFLGYDDQAACQSLIDALPGKWTAAHRLCGVAYTYVRIKYDSNVFNSLPIVTADIHGRTVYDPRSGLTAWSNNPSLCSRDYMTNTRYGRGVPATEMDDVSYIVAANVCDSTFTAPDGTSHARHTCNGVVNTDQSSADNMVNILACCRGMLVFSARGYGLVIDKAEVPSDFEFNEDNIAGSWTFSPGGKRSRFNRVRGNWYNPANDWQADIAVADSPTFRAEDNGLMLEAQVQIPFVTNPYEVQVLTERHLRQSRFGLTATFRAFISGMFCEVGYVVRITHSTPGWVAKPFRITRISLLSSDEVEVEVAEYDDAVYSATPLTTPRLSMTTNLPDPSNVPPPSNLVLAMSTVDQPNGSSVPRFTATWTAPLSMWVVGYDVAWREDDSPWDTAFVTEPKFTLLATAVGRSYEVLVRSVGSLGNKSVWVSTSGTQPVPTTPPAAPLAHAVGGLFCVRLDWAFGDTRQDIRATEIWYCGNNDRAAAMRLSSEPFPSREYTHPGMAPGAGGYYWLRVIDVWGNESAWYPAAEHGGLYAGCSTDPSDLLTQLQGALGMPQLAAELAAPIAQIDGMATDIIQRSLDLDGLSERVLYERAVTDATIKTDPITGKIQLLATAVTTTDVEARLTQAEVDIDAATGTLTSAVATLADVGSDLSSAQSQIAQLSDSVALKASSVYVNDAIGAATGAITVESAAAQQALAEAAIRQALSLDAATDKELAGRARVAVAEQAIKANSDELSAEASYRLALAAVVDQQKAVLTNEQTVRADALRAEAEERLTLAAAVAAGDETNAAAIQEVQRTAADATSAVALRTTALEASVNSPSTGLATKASVAYTDQAKADAISAAASHTDTVRSEIEIAVDAAQDAANAAQGAANTAISNAATAQNTANTAADAASAAASTANDVQARLSTGDFAAVKQESIATAYKMGQVEAKWVMKTQTMADGVNAVAGIELISGAGGGAFAALADKFLFYRPDGTGAPKQLMTMGSVNGVWALGFDGSAIFDGTVVARAIDSRGLAIRDAAGNIILGAGTALPLDYAASGTKNSDLIPSISNAAATANWGNVTGTGRPADNATVGATFGTNVFGQITRENSTYIAHAAISTLHLDGECVIIPRSATGGYEAAVTFYAPEPMNVYMLGVFTQGTARYGYWVRLYMDAGYLTGESPADGTLGTMARLVPVSAGWHTATIASDIHSGDMRCNILVLGVMR